MQQGERGRARAAFRRGNPCLLLRDWLCVMFDDAGSANLYPKRGHPVGHYRRRSKE